MGAIMGAECILLKIRGCHGSTPGTHANTPSDFDGIVDTMDPYLLFRNESFCPRNRFFVSQRSQRQKKTHLQNPKNN